MQLINGKEVAKKLRLDIKSEVEKLPSKPGLAVILLGENPASQIYVGKKHKACLEVGFNSYQHKLPDETSEEELLTLINELNKNKNVNGILVQLPIPKHINKNKVINAIDVKKDVDGFSPENIGKLLVGEECLEPCTPKGIMKLLSSYNVNLVGKDVVVIGRSMIVGTPVANMFIQAGSTVTVCHSKTKNLKEKCLNADIIVSAVGKANLITSDMIKEGVVIIDVGMNKVDGKLCGDVDFENVKKKCSLITPVPGGVGPMTIACLLENTLKAYKIQKYL